MAPSPRRPTPPADSPGTPVFGADDDVFELDDASGHVFIAPTGDLHGTRHLVADATPPYFMSSVAHASVTSEDDDHEKDEPSPVVAAAPRASRYHSAISGLKSLSSAPSNLLGKGKYAKAQLLSKIPYKKAKARVSNLPPPTLCSECPPKAPSKLSLYRQKSAPPPMWTCVACPHVHLCESCYRSGVHGLEGSDAMETYDELISDLKWMKACKAFTKPLLRMLRQDICNHSPSKYQFMCAWLADILGTKPVAKITMRGVAMKDLRADARQAFVAALMPLVANRSDLDVNIEWASSADDNQLENLRLWISDKKGRRESPFDTSLLTTELHDHDAAS